jgi:hypothetical protein
MASPYRALRRKACRALVWTLVVFAAVQGIVAVYLLWVRPELRDPEFEPVRHGLQARLATLPNRPLVLILGTSRAATMFRPNALPPPPAGQPAPLVHNCAFLASGPIRELLMLRRFLADGVRPDWLLVEIWPAYLVQRGVYWEDATNVRRDLRAVDWPVVSNYFSKLTDARSLLLTNVLVPSFAYRRRLLEELAPDLLPPEKPNPFVWVNPPRPADEAGWMKAPGVRVEAKAGAFNASVFRVGFARLSNPFEVYPPADRALRDLLTLASRHGARVALVLYPDHSDLRDGGSAQIAEAYRAYLAKLSAEFGVPVIDVRDWIADGEFTDPTHAHASAAGPFTERFGREILYPLLAGRSLPPAVLLPAGNNPSPVNSPLH